MRRRPAFWGAHALLGAGALAAALAGSCADAGPPSRTIRSVMYEIDALKRSIEPNYRNPERVPELAEWGRGILAATDENAFANHPASAFFQGDAELFRRYHSELRTATEAFVTAAEAGELDPLRDAWIEMNITCTRCHKRFDPTY